MIHRFLYTELMVTSDHLLTVIGLLVDPQVERLVLPKF
jgi:hypothetical protein